MAQQPATKPKPFKESEFWSFEGYPLDLRSEPDKHEENYSCGKCKKLARHAVEMACDVHLEDPNFNPSPYCKGPTLLASPPPFCQHHATHTHNNYIDCLNTYLESHSNECPVGGHKEPKSQANLFIRRAVGQILVKCPREVRRSKESSETIMNRQGCTWVGKIRTLNVRFVFFALFFLSFFLPPPTRDTPQKNKQKNTGAPCGRLQTDYDSLLILPFGM